MSRSAGFLREQIRACINARLADPGLSAASIAQQLKLSPSTLHRAWAGEPCSIQETIRAQRLDTARRDLCDPNLVARSVSEIAYSCGFSNAAHFSRAVRARFGCSARDLRAEQSVPHQWRKQHARS
ncbi:MAG: helix-turn-helix transcriptional regulator [Burkholderiaceae bacterium]